MVLASNYPFTYTSVMWGSNNTPIQAGPGDNNVPLTVNMQYLGSDKVTSVSAVVSLPSGFTNTTGSQSATTAANIASSPVFALVFYLGISDTAQLGNYVFPMTVSYLTTATAQTNVWQSMSMFVVVNLAGKATLLLSSPNVVLSPGRVNNISVILDDVGTGNASQVSVTASGPAGVSVLNSFPTITSLPAKSAVTLTTAIFVPSSDAGGAVSVTFVASYKDAYYNSQSTTQTVGFYVSTAVQSTYAVQASLHSLVVGEQTPVVISFDNTGTATMTNVVVVLSGQLPLTVVGGDGSFSIGTLSPGSRTTITVTLYVATSSSQMVSLPITITYRDASGSVISASRTINFLLASAPGGFVLLNTAWGTSSNPIEAGPGETDALLSVTLQYFGNTIVTSLHALLSLPGSFTDQSGAKTALAYATGISPSSVFVLSFWLKIASNAPVSQYDIPVRLNWNDSLASSMSTTLDAIVPLNGKVDPSVSVLNSGLYPGKVNNVTLQVTNKGTGALSQLQLTPTLSAGSLLNQVAKIQALNAGSTATVPLQIFIPQSGAGLAISLSLEMTYYDAYGNPRSATTTVGFFVQSSAASLSQLVVVVSPTELLAGEMNNVSIALANTGPLALSNLSVTFASSGTGLTWLSPTMLKLSRLTSGQNVTIPGSVFVDAAAPDSNTLQLSVKYLDSNNNLNQETRSFGLLTKGIVELLLQDASTVPAAPTAGQVFSITGTITNIGTTTASGLSAEPQLPEGFKVFGSQSVFIGNLAVNTPTAFTITLTTLSSVKPGSYSIPVRLTYLDNLRETLTTTIIVPVSMGVGSTNSSSSSGTGTTAGQGRVFSVGWLAAAILAIVALVAGFLVARRRYSKK